VTSPEWWRVRLRQLLAGNEPPQFFFCDSVQAIQVLHLRVQGVVGPIEPESAIRTTMNSQRAANGIAEISWTDRIMSGKYLDAVNQPRALRRYS